MWGLAMALTRLSHSNAWPGTASVKINLKGTESEGVDWIQLIQDRVQWGLLLNTAVNLFQKKVRNFSRMTLFVGVTHMPQQ
jgi:hypothetical protein